MIPHLRLLAAAAILGAACLAPATPGDAALRDRHRLVLVSARDPADPRIARQRRILAAWQRGAAERDVSLIEIGGDRVTGAADTAAALRRRYGIAADRFEAVLVGKDGHVALRSPNPIDPKTLQATIDAMPMRRAGER